MCNQNKALWTLTLAKCFYECVFFCMHLLNVNGQKDAPLRRIKAQVWKKARTYIASHFDCSISNFFHLNFRSMLVSMITFICLAKSFCENAGEESHLNQIRQALSPPHNTVSHLHFSGGIVARYSNLVCILDSVGVCITKNFRRNIRRIR